MTPAQIKRKLAAMDRHEAKEEEKARARERSLWEIQAQCPHPDVIEGEYQRMEYVDSYPPFLVCRVCGYAEGGWGCGGWRIKDSSKHPKMPRDDAEELVRDGIVHQRDMEALGRWGQTRALEALKDSPRLKDKAAVFLRFPVETRLVRNTSDAKSKAFWDAAERAAAEIATWPQWKRDAAAAQSKIGKL